MPNLREYWNATLNLGCEHVPVPLEAKYVQITNAICVIAVVGTLGQLPLFLVYLPASFVLVCACVLFAAVLSLTFWLNARGARLQATLNLNLSAILFMAGMSWMLGREGNTHFIQLGVLLASFTAYPGRWKAAIAVITVLSGGSFLFFHFASPSMEPVLTLPAEFTSVFRVAVIVTLLFVIAGFSFFSQIVLRDTDQRLETMKVRAEAAHQESERLLVSILPARTAAELRATGRVEPLFYDSVSVLFADFVGFTSISESLLPDELVTELDGYFTRFDEIAGRYRMEKLKTIGDAYMAAGGLPEINTTNPLDACITALEFHAFMNKLRRERESAGESPWQLRIGIHTGPVTAGVIGKSKFTYDIWGDTVNTASRMEAAGTPGRINVSSATYEHIHEYFECEYRGRLAAKGKGEVDMYFVHRLKPDYSIDPDGLAPNGDFYRVIAERLDYAAAVG